MRSYQMYLKKNTADKVFRSDSKYSAFILLVFNFTGNQENIIFFFFFNEIYIRPYLIEFKQSEIHSVDIDRQ